jgi:hypothetical protein
MMPRGVDWTILALGVAIAALILATLRPSGTSRGTTWGLVIAAYFMVPAVLHLYLDPYVMLSAAIIAVVVAIKCFQYGRAAAGLVLLAPATIWFVFSSLLFAGRAPNGVFWLAWVLPDALILVAATMIAVDIYRERSIRKRSDD